MIGNFGDATRTRALCRLAAAALILLVAAIPVKAASTFIPIIVPQQPILPPAKTADYGVGHTVAVLSVLGDHMTLRNNHFSGSKEKQINIRDWGLDAAIDAKLKQYLSGRFNFKDVAFDGALLANIPNGPWDNSAKFSNFVKSLPSEGLDYFFIVRPDLVMQAPGIEGLALETGGALGDATPIIWANYEIDLVDAHTDSLVATAYSRARLHDGQVAFAGIAAPDLATGDDFRFTPDESALLRRTVDSIVSVSLVETLRALNIGDNLPATGARTVLPIPREQNPYKDYQNVAVISALGDTVTLHHIGGTIFSQSDAKVNEPDWHIDMILENRARAALAKQFNVVEPNVDRATFANASVSDDNGKLAVNLPGLKRDPKIDFYVAVIGRTAPAYAVNMPKLKGVGVFDRRPIAGQPDVTAAFAHFVIAVVDAHTMKIIAAHPGVVAPDHAFLLRPNSTFPDLFLTSALLEAEPLENVGTENWPAAPLNMTPSQAALIHDKVVEVLNNSLDETLLRLSLLGVRATEGAPLETVNPQ